LFYSKKLPQSLIGVAVIFMPYYRFHEKMGFTTVGRFHRVGYKFNAWYDVIWMEKMLAEHSCPPPEVRFGKWAVME